MSQNPNNPYVINPYLYSNVTNLSYEQTTFSTFHTLFNLLGFVFGFSISSLLIFLVLKKTPKTFEDFSHLVLACAIVDLLSVINNFLSQFRLKFSTEGAIFSATGVIKFLPYSFQCHFVCIFGVCQICMFMLLIYEYSFRFVLIKTNKPPTLIQRFICLFSLTIFVFLNYYTGYEGYCLIDKKAGQVDFAPEWYPELNIPLLIVGTDKSTIFGVKYGSYVYMTTLVSSYALSVYFACMTKRILNLNATQLKLSGRTIELQKKFSNALFCQSIIPLGNTLLPSLIIFISTKIGFDTIYAVEYNMITIVLHPCLNSVFNVLFISSYRRYCWNILKRVFQKSTSNTSVTTFSSNT